MAPKKEKAKSPAGAAPKKEGAKPKASSRSDVEKRWQEYWKYRTELENACDAVRSAQSTLVSAVERERKSRAVFENAKKVLKELLEVESPASSIDDLSNVPSLSNIVDFDKS